MRCGNDHDLQNTRVRNLLERFRRHVEEQTDRASVYVIGDFNSTTPICRYPELNRNPYRTGEHGGTHRNGRELDWIFTNREIQVKSLPQSLNTSDHILAYFDMPDAYAPIKKPRYQFREKLVNAVNEMLVD